VVTSLLLLEHRGLEDLLDRLESAIHARAGEFDAARATAGAAAAHYANEAAFLERLAQSHPAVAAKIAGQHAQVLELAAAIEQAAAAAQPADVTALARRLHAMAQHNIIEEERDVFPLAVGWYE
jgi:alkylation response protein AidB-like acyl-CoA dehydrogenase